MSLDSETLEEAARRLEQRSANELYRKAWKAAAKLLRMWKDEKLNADSIQIIDRSDRPV